MGDYVGKIFMKLFKRRYLLWATALQKFVMQESVFAQGIAATHADEIEGLNEVVVTARKCANPAGLASAVISSLY